MSSTIADWVTLDRKQENRDRTTTNPNPTSTLPKQLVEAQGWIIGSDGR